MKLKKTLSKILVLAIALSCFAGCSSEKKNSDGSVPTLLWYVHGDKQADSALINEAMSKITEEKIGAKVQLEFIDQPSYTEKMQMMMASNAAFDICFTGYVNTYTNAVSRGGLIKLDEYLEKAPALKASIPEYVWELAHYDDGIYAVPNLQILAKSIQYFTFKDLADKYNFPVNGIETAKELEPYLEAIRDNEPDYFPIRVDYGQGLLKGIAEDGSYMKDSVVSGVEIRSFDDGSYDVVSTLDTAEDIKTRAKMMRDWYKRGFIREDIATVTTDAQDYQMGRYAMWAEKYKPGYLAELQQRYGKEVVTVRIKEPVLSSTTPDAMTGISKTTQDAELSVKFLELINTDKELYNIVAFGIEGKHYNLNEEGKVVYAENSGYAPKAAWKFGNQFNALFLEGQEDTVWEETMKMNDEALKSNIAGFVLSNDEIKNEISQVSAIIKEYDAAIHKGIEDVDSFWDEYASRLEAAGITRIKENVIKQLKDWENNK